MTDTVLITDHDFPDFKIEREILNQADIQLLTAQAKDEREVLDALESTEQSLDAIITQFAPITQAVFEKIPDVAVVGRFGIGINNIDVESATDHGIPVVNVPSYCEDEVAEHTLSLLLACVRQVPQYNQSVKNGSWDWRNGKPIQRLEGQTIGFVGFGKIPQTVLQKASGFNFEKLVFDPYISSELLTEYGAEDVDFDELLARSDIISVHTPLTDETRGMFDTEAFEAMKRSGYLVNTSRGAVIDVKALYRAIESGEIAGAGLDVFPYEPPGEIPLLELDEVIVTPHVAWYSEQSIEDLRRIVVEDVAGVLSGEPPKNPVNDVE